MIENLKEADISKSLRVVKPVLLIDSAEVWRGGEPYLQAECFMDESYPFWECHFVNNPVMPGTYMLEMIAQSAAILIMMITGCNSVPIITGITNVRFLREIKPNQHIRSEIKLKKITGQYYTTVGKVMCGDKNVCKAEMIHCVKAK